MTRDCTERRKDGNPCGMPPLADSEFCFAHDPRNRREAQAARRKGGVARQINQRGRAAKNTGEKSGEKSGNPPPLLRSVTDIQEVLEQAVGDVLALENSALRSRTLGYLSQIALRALEVGDLEARLNALESQLSAQPRRRTG